MLQTWQTIADPTEKRHAYYASREWGLKKEAVKARCGGICERCSIHPMDQVHHLTYIRLYDERLEDLQAICRGCHEFTHGKRDDDPAQPDPYERAIGWDLKQLVADGLVIFNTDSFDSTVLACPICGHDYNHFAGYETHDGQDSYKAKDHIRYCVRGDVKIIKFVGECGHEWELRFGFHKGQIYVETAGE